MGERLAREPLAPKNGGEIGVGVGELGEDLDGAAVVDQSGGVAFDTSRVTVRTDPRPEGITWTVIDTSIENWIKAACSAFGRALTSEELASGGIDSPTGACP